MNRKAAMISSTAVDLPEHRAQAMTACLRADLFPIAMEHEPATDSDAIAESMRMVNEADIYLGIYGQRYGTVPKGCDISITEMEFNRAVERGLPILVFIMHKEHQITIDMVQVETEAKEKLARLKAKACEGRIRAEFKSAVELRGEVFAALLSELKRQEAKSGVKAEPDIHPPNNIPKPPEPYIAHPYSLLQTKNVVGRQDELNLLTDWVTTNKVAPSDTRIFSVMAIGGMGKSALTWKWFNDIVPNELPKLAGRMWWSFYESDAHYENFVIRALAYVSGQTEKAVREMKSPDREEQLWGILDQQPFLLVLDGLERILLAYARMDAAHMLDEELDKQTANRVAGGQGLPGSARPSFTGKHLLRCAVDRQAGQFLRRLAGVKQSRILITTRLYPAELQTDTANPLPGCFSMFLEGLKDDDALHLWREFKISGSRENLLPLFRSLGNHPLLLRALAGEVAEYKPAPGNFVKWHKDNPGFNPAGLPLEDGKAHVLEYALRGLGQAQRQVLNTLAAFRMPATWDALRALLVGESKPCADDRALDALLTELEDRGLMGWDKKSNRYDLHPVVRGVVWASLAPEAKKSIYRALQTYFAAAPRPPEWERVERLEDLTTAVEQFDKLIGLERYDEAFGVFREQLNLATLHRLSASRLRVELLESLFPDGVDAPPRLQNTSDHSFLLNALGLAYRGIGEPGRAALLLKRAAERDDRDKFAAGLRVKLHNLSGALWLTGQMRVAESAGRLALVISRELGQRPAEAEDIEVTGTVLASRGDFAPARVVLRRSAAIFAAKHYQQSEGREYLCLAQLYLWRGQPDLAQPLAERGWEMVRAEHFEENVIFAFRLRGEAALLLGDLGNAEEHLNQALTRARAVNLVHEELCALNALAELDRRRQQHDSARKLLEQVWAPAERGPYPLWHADALNVLAQIERDQGHRDAAVAAATKAFTLAWCDGPPYAYHYGLSNARKHLQELGAPEPKLAPFNESKFTPMREVELNPNDKYWVDPDKLDDSF